MYLVLWFNEKYFAKPFNLNTYFVRRNWVINVIFGFNRYMLYIYFYCYHFSSILFHVQLKRLCACIFIPPLLLEWYFWNNIYSIQRGNREKEPYKKAGISWYYFLCQEDKIYGICLCIFCESNAYKICVAVIFNL